MIGQCHTSQPAPPHLIGTPQLERLNYTGTVSPPATCVCTDSCSNLGDRKMTTGTHAFIALLWWFVMRCSGDQDHARDHVMSDSVRAACLRKDETACSVLRSEVQYNTTNLRLNGCLNSHSTQLSLQINTHACLPYASLCTCDHDHDRRERDRDRRGVGGVTHLKTSR